MIVTGFAGKTAIVTGAASGMGLLTAQCLAKEGANVLMLDINAEQVENCAREIRENGGSARAMGVDVREYAQIKGAVDFAIATFGQVDYTVSCAGGSSARVLQEKGSSFKEWSVSTLDWGIDVNLRAPMYLAHAVIGHMMERKTGVIIHIGSIDGQTGSSSVDYSAAKSGVMFGLTKSLARYGAPYGVRVNCVSPGPVLTRPAMANMPTLLGRAAQPQEIVDLILYLCSDQAAFITGANYMIDGGRACGIWSVK